MCHEPWWTPVEVIRDVSVLDCSAKMRQKPPTTPKTDELINDPATLLFPANPHAARSPVNCASCSPGTIVALENATANLQEQTDAIREKDRRLKAGKSMPSWKSPAACPPPWPEHPPTLPPPTTEPPPPSVAARATAFVEKRKPKRSGDGSRFRPEAGATAAGLSPPPPATRPAGFGSSEKPRMCRPQSAPSARPSTKPFQATARLVMLATRAVRPPPADSPEPKAPPTPAAAATTTTAALGPAALPAVVFKALNKAQRAARPKAVGPLLRGEASAPTWWAKGACSAADTLAVSAALSSHSRFARFSSFLLFDAL